MATYRPLVLVGGRLKELSGSDSIVADIITEFLTMQGGELLTDQSGNIIEPNTAATVYGTFPQALSAAFTV